MLFESLPLILIPASGVRKISPSHYYSKGSLIGPLREFILLGGYPLNVLSRPLGPETRSCCGASRDNQSLE
jgi:hypothetical protein